MAHAAANLENPPSKPAGSSPADAAPDADDMLSQLAGSEIDRLLAEADQGGESSAGNSEEQAVAEETAAAETTLTGELNQLFDELQKDDNLGKAPASAVEPAAVEIAAPAAKVAAPPPSAEETAALTNQLDALFTELKNEDPTDPPAPVAATEALPLNNQMNESFNELNKDNSERAPAAADAQSAKPEVKIEPSADGAERKALLEAAGFDTKAAPADAAPKIDPERAAVLNAAGFESGQGANADHESFPLYLKILEWLNSPLRFCPDPIRQAMGRAALVTLINSVLVIGYVLIFRKH